MNNLKLFIFIFFIFFMQSCKVKDVQCEALYDLAKNENVIASLREWIGNLDKHKELKSLLNDRAGTVYARERADRFNLPVDLLKIPVNSSLSFGFFDKKKVNDEKLFEAGFFYIGFGERKHLVIRVNSDANILGIRELNSVHKFINKISDDIYVICRN